MRRSFEKKTSVNWQLTIPFKNPIDPIFMIGFPRSGTTLLDSILRSHPQIEILEEQPFIEQMKNSLVQPINFNSLKNLSDSEIESLRTEYIFKINRSVQGCGSTKFVIDKFPLNLVHTGLIHRVFPTAKFILSIRHPYDCVLSCFMQNFKINDAMENFLSLKQAAKFYNEVMSLWIQYEQKLLIKRHVVKYEDLIHNLKGTTLPILKFLNLDWNSSLLEYQTTALSRGFINTPSYHQVLEKLNSDAVGRWENYSSNFSGINSILSPWVTKYGYK
jgi:hypothetical protein